jgi:hypothetical protein
MDPVMVSTITSASPVAHGSAAAVQTPQPGSASAKSGPTAQQLAALKQLLSKYATDQSHGAAASTLAGLGKQITAMAKSLGQNVSLPRASSTASAPAASAPPETGKVNVTA